MTNGVSSSDNPILRLSQKCLISDLQSTEYQADISYPLEDVPDNNHGNVDEADADFKEEYQDSQGHILGHDMYWCILW